MTNPKDDEYSFKDAMADAATQNKVAAPPPVEKKDWPKAEDIGELRRQVIAALREVYDPELPVNLYDLGLIYKIEIADDWAVKIEMTLTAPGCPVAGEMPGMIEQAVLSVPGVEKADATLVWDPPWDKSMMSEAVALELGLL